MPVSKDTVIHTSKLARLNLGAGAEGAQAEAKIARFAGEMEAIVSYIDMLDQADTDGVEPLFAPQYRTAPPRADEVKQEYTREEVLANAPDQDQGFFMVPKVL